MAISLAILAGCSGEGPADPAQNDGVVEVPEPSGPPVVQQVENETEPAAVEEARDK